MSLGYATRADDVGGSVGDGEERYRTDGVAGSNPMVGVGPERDGSVRA
jgi:hypothetical protein